MVGGTPWTGVNGDLVFDGIFFVVAVKKTPSCAIYLFAAARHHSYFGAIVLVERPSLASNGSLVEESVFTEEVSLSSTSEIAHEALWSIRLSEKLPKAMRIHRKK